MKILFFAPHALLWIHAFPEALVAEALRDAGHDVVYVGCGGVFKRNCICMTASRLPHGAAEAAREEVCSGCRARKDLIVSEFGFRSYDISEVLDETHEARVQEILAQTTPANFLELKVANVEVGRAALSTYLLTYKKSRLEFSADEWKVYQTELGNTLRSAFASQVVLEQEKPDRVIVYSSGYSVNLVWCHLLEQRGTPFYYMNAGSNLSDRLQKLVIAKGHSLQRKLLEYWPAFRQVPCSENAAAYVVDHFVELLNGRHVFVYSAPKMAEVPNLKKKFGVCQGQKVLLATMSSYDELFAAQATKLFPDDFPLIFPRQADWLKALVAFMRGRPDLHLIVRVHPREFPNKRDGVKSDHAAEIESVLADLPSNVRVNWPSDAVSLYDLAEITDVCLNSWSTVGKELGMLGIPVVVYSADLIFYPSDLNYVGKDEADYLAQIDRALADGWSSERVRYMFRWLALEDLYSRIDISDAFLRKENPKRTIVHKVTDRVRGMLAPDFHEINDCRLRPQVMKSSKAICDLIERDRSSIVETVDPSALPIISEEEEDAILKMQMRRIYAAMYQRGAPAGAQGLAAKLREYAFS